MLVPHRRALVGVAVCAVIAVAATGVGLGLAVGVHRRTSTGDTSSLVMPVAAPQPSPSHGPKPRARDAAREIERRQAFAADRAFRKLAAGGDEAGACSHAYGFRDDTIVPIVGTVLHQCEATLGSSGIGGTSTVLGSVMVHGTVALVARAGVDTQMPADGSAAAFGAALSEVFASWTAGKIQGTPDVLLKVDDEWFPLVPIGVHTHRAGWPGGRTA
jgi:hypothetical protein